MIEDKQIIEVTNRSTGSAGYTIPDLNNLYRSYSAGETKKVTAEEMRKLAQVPGGKALIEDCLIIKNEELVNEVLGNVEIEYYYNEEEVKDLLLNKPLDALLDCLDYAPAGTIDLVKKVAVDLEIVDISKRDAILKATGFNVTKAIEINHLTQDEDKQEKPSGIRRIQPEPEKVEKAEQRRYTVEKPVTLSADKYKVVK